MRRIAIVTLAAVIAFVAGTLAASHPSGQAGSVGITSVGTVQEGVERVVGTTLWLTRGGSVYRCYRTDSGQNPPFKCVKQSFDFD
jgi:hypothetical protein